MNRFDCRQTHMFVKSRFSPLIVIPLQPASVKTGESGNPVILASSPGRPEESHLQSPTDPYVSLSTHTARVSHSLEASQLQVDNT
jgi:hypothetical protein